MTGFSREEVIGKSTVDLGIWTARAAGRRSWPRCARPRRAEVDVPYRTKDGRPLTLAHRQLARIDFGGEPCLVNVATDVTERRAAEAALRESEARGPGARRRAGGADGRRAGRRLDRAGSRLPRGARQPDGARAAAPRRGGRTCRKTAADPTADLALQGLRQRDRRCRPTELPLQRAARGVGGAKPRGGDPLRRRAGDPPLRQRRSAARSERRPARVDRRLRRRDAPQAGGGGAAGGRSPEGRVPGAAVARAAQPAGADPHAPRSSCSCAATWPRRGSAR